MSRIKLFLAFLKRPWGIVLVVVVLGTAAYIVFGAGKKAAPEIVVVKRGNIAQEVSVTGQVKPIQSVDLGFDIAGRVARVPVAVGDHVNRGDLLVALDAGDLQAQLAEAQANVDAEQANLDSLEAGTRPEELQLSAAKVTSAQVAVGQSLQAFTDALRDAQVKADDAIRNKVDPFFTTPQTNPQLVFSITDPQLQLDLESMRLSLEGRLTAWRAAVASFTTSTDPTALDTMTQADLALVQTFLGKVTLALNNLTPYGGLAQATIDGWRANVSTARANIGLAITDLTTAREAYLNAETAVTVAENQYALDAASSTPEDIAAQTARVEQAQGSVDSIRAQIAKTYILSPLAGVVTQQDAKVGQAATPNTPLTGVMGDGGLEIEADIAEADIAKVAVGQSAAVTLDAYGPGVQFPATVVKIDPAETILEGVATYKTTLQFVQKDDRVKSGMTANVDITTAEHDNVLVLPQYAVTNANGVHTVQVERGAKVETVTVTTGLRSLDGTTEILSGLAEGDQVVVAGSATP